MKNLFVIIIIILSITAMGLTQDQKPIRPKTYSKKETRQIQIHAKPYKHKSNIKKSSNSHKSKTKKKRK